MSEAVQQSVGRHGRNHRHDVLVVQMLLNNHISALGPRRKLSLDGMCGPQTQDAILEYQKRVLRMTHPDGVIDPGGRTIQSLTAVATVKHKQVVQQVHQVQKLQSPKAAPVANVTQVAPPPKTVPVDSSSSHKYTDSPLELAVKTTKIDPMQLAVVLRKAWPELTVDGSLVMAAQYMSETKGGLSCYCYNLGNVKCTDPQSRRHMYLKGTWELLTIADADKMLSSNKLSRIAMTTEIKKKTGTLPAGKKMLFFEPPDWRSRFRAYLTLDEGVIDWTDRYKKTAKRHPGFLESTNKGDCTAFATTLHADKYFTQILSVYIKEMKSYKAQLDARRGKQ